MLYGDRPTWPAPAVIAELLSIAGNIMARPLRLEYPGAFWHVLNRGVERRDIYLDEIDRRRFLKVLAAAAERFRWRIHAYVLMTNHYHLLVETLEPTLSRGVKAFAADYAGVFNKRHARVGPLFQGRFKAHLIDSEEYLLSVARYVVLNPTRAGLVTRARSWPWSSYRATAGLTKAPSWLFTDAVLARFHPTDVALARTEYRRYVDEPDVESPWKELVGQTYLGSERFIERTQERIDECRRSREYPRAQRLICPVGVDDVRDAVASATGQAPGKWASREVRMAYARLACSEALAPLKLVGEALGIGATGVRYLIRSAEAMQRSNGEFARLLEEVRLKIKTAD